MKALKVMLLASLILAIAVPMASAQLGTWDSSFNIINLDTTSTATVSVTFYAEDGTPQSIACLRGSPCELANPFTLAPGAKEEIYVPGVPGLADGRYSVVVSADRPIAAIASLAGNDNNSFYTASYTGMEDKSQVSMFLPGVQWQFYAWDSHFSTQNLTAADQDISVEFYAEGSNTVCHTEGPHSTPMYSSWHLDVGALDLSACNVDGVAGYNGSAKVTAAGPIAVVDNQTTNPASADCLGCHFEVAYSGFVQGETTLYVPDLYLHSFPATGSTGWNSSMNVQNVGTADTVVTIDFKTSPEVIITKTLTPNQGWLVYLPSVAGLPDSPWDTFSALITTDGQSVVAIVSAANPLFQAMTYNAVLGGGATVAVPTVMRLYYGWDSSFVTQNLGSDPVVVHVVYSANANPAGPVWAGASYDSAAIASGDSLLIYQGNGDDALFAATGERVPEGYTGGVILTITSGTGPIAAVVNTTNGPGQMFGTPGDGDWSTSFNAINQ